MLIKTKIISINKGIDLHFKPSASWDARDGAYVHVWGTEPGGLETSWPGLKLRRDENGFFHHKLPGQTFTNVVFHDAAGHQTGNLFRTGTGYFIDNLWWDYNPDILKQFLFPGGKEKALVTSWDDAGKQDRNLVRKILNKSGIVGTFHIPSDRLKDGTDWYLARNEIKDLYVGHEVSAHVIGHYGLEGRDPEFIKYHVGEDRYQLEQLMGRDVGGLAYPFGNYDDNVLRLLPELGIEYARTVQNTFNFKLPLNFLTWHPTVWHLDKERVFELGHKFLNLKPDELSVFFVWGHSYELDDNGGWNHMENFCNLMGGKNDIWYAGALDVRRYIDAVEHIETLPNGKLFNPSKTITVWVKVNGKAVELLPETEGN